MTHPSPRPAVLALVLAVGMLFIVSPAGAAVLPQQADGVVGGMNNWYTLAPGRSVEWVFRYPGGENPALIAFGVDPVPSIMVNVYDDDQWRSLGAGDGSVEPVGRGTPGTLDEWRGSQELIDNGNLFWEAAAGSAALFHIQVTNASQAPARYWIAQGGSAAGELVPYAQAAAASPTVQPAAAAPMAAAPAPQQPAGAQGLPPPQTLPVTGGASLIWALGAGLGLVAVGWLRLTKRTTRL